MIFFKFQDFRVFKNICTWASQYCPSNGNRQGMGVVKNEETPTILETGEEVL
jgi:hypothetical protein